MQKCRLPVVAESQSLKSSGIKSSNGVESTQVPPETTANKSLLSRINHDNPQSQVKGSVSKENY